MVLVVLVGGDARAVLDAVKVLLGELAVALVTGHAESTTLPSSALYAMSSAARRWMRSKPSPSIFSVARAMISGPLDAERAVHVLEEGLLRNGRCIPRLAYPAAVALRMILSSTSVMFMTCLSGRAKEAHGPAQGVDVEKGAEVADMAVVVDGGATAIKPELLAVGGKKGLDLPGEGVEEVKSLVRHAWSESVCRRRGVPPCLASFPVGVAAMILADAA